MCRTSTSCRAHGDKKAWPVKLLGLDNNTNSPTNVDLSPKTIGDGPINLPASTAIRDGQAWFSTSIGIVTFNLNPPLGAGNDGTVYGGSLTTVGLDVDQKIAIKLLKELNLNLIGIESDLEGSPNLLTNIDAGKVIHNEANRSYMVYPLMPHTLNTVDAQTLALQRDNGLRATMTDACTALVYMHDKNICHRDITLDNLFINSNDQVVFGDFGSAKHIVLSDAVPIKTKEYMQTWLTLQLPPTANVGEKRTFSAFDQPQVNGRQCDVMMLGMTLTMLIAGVTFNPKTFYSDGMGTLFEPLIQSINQSASPDNGFKLQPNQDLMANAYHSDLVDDRINAMVKRHGRPATLAALNALKAMVTGTVTAPEALAMAQAI